MAVSNRQSRRRLDEYGEITRMFYRVGGDVSVLGAGGLQEENLRASHTWNYTCDYFRGRIYLVGV